MTILDFFDHFEDKEPENEMLAEGAMVLRQFALPYEKALLRDLNKIVDAAPFQHMTTPGGYTMSVGMTSCGQFGWVSSGKGYRYADRHPDLASAWPLMPKSFLDFASLAAQTAGFFNFAPDSCLINRYVTGARMGLHQDKDERDLSQPIVSVSLGIPAVFLFGGFNRGDKTMRIRLCHNDVVVWGGPSRLRFHGVQPVKDNLHPILGRQRINLTFRKTQ